ncbi:UbiA prenyltransferase family [Hygrophoropsis aurantiaca]|uniref:UbiA prenyltransferase family n=1 Tax=Hygrophoropsis aurantiaca TaxID=72124 RepID=A0ACB8AAR7_9AGAM|nr:UbiA prenyltransferase family [Hygrophoropsis aurantiaca]
MLSQISLLEFLKFLRNRLWILVLFTQDDFKTTIIPTTLFSVVIGPICHPSCAFHVFTWIWLHMLQFTLANQTQDPSEDEKNKKTRPLPAHLISLREAIIYRWLVVPTCLIFSAWYGSKVLFASISIACLTILYNELYLHRQWVAKNVLTACGYAAFEFGGVWIARCHSYEIDHVTTLAIVINAAVFATTLQAQDFKDVEGDRLIGRKTLPIVFPLLSRMFMLIGLPLWSLFLVRVWGMDVICGSLFVCCGLLTGARFVIYPSVSGDKVSCIVYSMWFSLVHLLPTYWRYAHN